MIFISAHSSFLLQSFHNRNHTQQLCQVANCLTAKLIISDFCKMQSSEKFCLKWNDFEKNVSKSFSQLRQQSGLFDVTLVSSDQKQVSAHRLVLSACSDFFKTIFNNNSHSHPLLYLDGVDSGEISQMLDYIYQGEVQIYQENLDRFLEIAQKFQLDGLMAEADSNETSDLSKEESSWNELRNKENTINPFVNVNNEAKKPKIFRERSMTIAKNESFEASNSEVHEKFQELVVQGEDKMFTCTVCNKVMSHKASMRRHIETHLTGLSYDCPTCGKTLRSSMMLTKHKSLVHQSTN